MASVNSHSFRQLMGCFATGITVATLKDPKLGRVGITINSFTSVSLTPPLISFCLDKKAHLYKAFRRTEFFVINILADEQRALSEYFANYRTFPEPKKIWDPARHVGPVLRDTLGHVICRSYSVAKGGDHSIFIGEVISLKQNKTFRTPLIYFQSGYRILKD